MNDSINMDSIRQHWQDWANKYGTSLRATTKCSSAKMVELDTLARTLVDIQQSMGKNLNILEVGCGNGQNILNLLDVCPDATFTGIDFIEEMIEAANSVKSEKAISDDRLTFQVGNVLDLHLPLASYDIIFTDRCLINLNTDALQHQAIGALAELIKPSGYLLMIENCQQTYNMQNHARESVGLPPRSPAEFNHFFNEEALLKFLPSVGINLLDIEDFISLHDIVLYVLVPMINGGKVDYDHPLVSAAATLNIQMSKMTPNAFGALGQNRLYKCQKAS